MREMFGNTVPAGEVKRVYRWSSIPGNGTPPPEGNWDPPNFLSQLGILASFPREEMAET